MQSNPLKDPWTVYNLHSVTIPCLLDLIEKAFVAHDKYFQLLNMQEAMAESVFAGIEKTKEFSSQVEALYMDLDLAHSNF